MDEKISEADKIKLKFEAIWKARQIEMESFGARALYVWGFLAICYAAYGFVVFRLCERVFLAPESSGPLSCPAYRAFNLILLSLAFAIFALSMLWVCLIKGAKAWAERSDWQAECFTHRHLRSNLQKDCGGSDPEFENKETARKLYSCVQQEIVSRVDSKTIFDHKNCTFCNGNPSHACLLGVFPNEAPKSYRPKWDMNLFTSNGGLFSPASIFWFVALLSTFVGFSLTLLHSLSCWFEAQNVWRIMLDRWCLTIIAVIPVLFCFVFFLCFVHCCLIGKILQRIRKLAMQQIGSMTVADEMQVLTRDDD